MFVAIADAVASEIVAPVDVVAVVATFVNIFFVVVESVAAVVAATVVVITVWLWLRLLLLLSLLL